MKYKLIAILLGVSLGAAMLTGCGSSDSTTDTEISVSESAEEEKNLLSVTGEITELRSDGFTLETDDGEEIEVAVTDDTEFTVGGFGNQEDFQPGSDDERPDDSDGDAPGMPDGDGNSGQAGQPGQPGESWNEDNDIAEKHEDAPDGIDPGNDNEQDEAHEESDGENGMPGSGMPDAPSDGGSGDMPSGDVPDGNMPSGDMEISLSDLSVGYTVTVTFADDGSAATVEISLPDNFSDMAPSEENTDADSSSTSL